MDKYKITDEELAEYGVEGAAHYFNGDPDENQKIFDRLPKLIAERHNQLVQDLLASGYVVKATNFGWMRMDKNGVLEASADGQLWAPVSASGEGGNGLAVTLTDSDISEEEIAAYEFTSREKNRRISDYKRRLIERDLQALKAEGTSASAKRIAVCAEALTYCTDTDLCPFDFPLSAYVWECDLYAMLVNSSKPFAVHKDTDNPDKLLPITDAVIQDCYKDRESGQEHLRSVIRHNPVITGADCAGGVSGLLFHNNVVRLWDSSTLSYIDYNSSLLRGEGTATIGFDDSGNAVTGTVANKINKDQMKPGDVVGYSGHVGLYVGGGYVVEWVSSGCHCQLTSLDNRRYYNFETKDFKEDATAWVDFTRPVFYGD